MTAMDEAAASMTSAFGEIIDDLGDFVVQRVKDLPETIKQVSDTVSKAVNEGGEQASHCGGSFSCNKLPGGAT